MSGLSGESPCPGLQVSNDGGIRRITLDRPDKLNALTREMLATLTELFESEPAPTDRITVIAAHGRAFCAGIDLGERARLGTPPLDRMCASVRSYPLPVVAAVQGMAVGGGTVLALHCDVILAIEEVELSINLAQIGLALPWALIDVVREKLGAATARDMLLSGRCLSARRLAEIGVISEVVADEVALLSATDAYAALAAGNAPLAMRAMKRALVRQENLVMECPHDSEDADLVALRASNDAQEGISAVRERRRPIYSGT